MRKRLLALLAVAAIGFAGKAEAQSVLVPTVQTGFLIGPVGGVNMVAYNTDAFPVLNSEKTCFTAQNGSDIAPWGGLTFEYPLGNANELENFIIVEGVRHIMDKQNPVVLAEELNSFLLPNERVDWKAKG